MRGTRKGIWLLAAMVAIFMLALGATAMATTDQDGPTPPELGDPVAGTNEVQSITVDATTATTIVTRLLTGLIDPDRATVQLGFVQLFDGLHGVVVVREDDEAEPAGTARVTIHDDRCFGDLAELLEGLSQPRFGRIPTDTADE